MELNTDNLSQAIKNRAYVKASQMLDEMPHLDREHWMRRINAAKKANEVNGRRRTRHGFNREARKIIMRNCRVCVTGGKAVHLDHAIPQEWELMPKQYREGVLKAMGAEGVEWADFLSNPDLNGFPVSERYHAMKTARERQAKRFNSYVQFAEWIALEMQRPRELHIGKYTRDARAFWAARRQQKIATKAKAEAKVHSMVVHFGSEVKYNEWKKKVHNEYHRLNGRYKRGTGPKPDKAEIKRQIAADMGAAF